MDKPKEKVQLLSSDKVLAKPLVYVGLCVKEILAAKQLTIALFIRDLRAQ